MGEFVHPPQRDQRQFWLPRGVAAPEIQNKEIRERKRLLVLAMDFDGVAFYELLNENETLNSNRYLSFLWEYIPQWCQRRRCRRPLILHDNARPHKARIILDLLRKETGRYWTTHYSPNLHPCDYNCFAPLKRQLKAFVMKGSIS